MLSNSSIIRIWAFFVIYSSAILIPTILPPISIVAHILMVGIGLLLVIIFGKESKI